MIRAYTNRSKGERGVGAGVVIFVRNELIARHKLKLNYSCSNNQAEQLAILKVLDLINYLVTADNSPRTIRIYTDSRITTDPLKNAGNHNYLIEEIRKNIITLRSNKWTIEF
jgi:ribonuclease HI